MTVKEFIDKLSKFDPEAPIIFSDGYKYRFYDSRLGEVPVVEFLDGADVLCVDIGLADCSEEKDALEN